MADVALSVSMDENATPVLKGIQTAAASAMTGVQAATAKAAGALGQFTRANNAAEVSAKKAGATIKPAIAGIASEFAGLGGAAGLASGAVVAFAMATGPLGFALAGLASGVAFLVYKIGQAKESLAELSERELAKIGQETGFLKLDQDIRNMVRSSEAGADKIRQIAIEMDQLRIVAGKANDPKMMERIDRLQRSEVANAIKGVTDDLVEQAQALKAQRAEMVLGIEAGAAYRANLAAKRAEMTIGAVAAKLLTDEIARLTVELKQTELQKSFEATNQTLQVQHVTMTQGKIAGQDLAIVYKLMQSNLNTLTPGITAAIEKQKLWNRALEEAAVASKMYDENQSLAKEALSLRERLKQDSQRLEADLTGDLGSEIQKRIADARMEAAERMKSVQQQLDFAIITEQEAARRRQAIQRAAFENSDPFAGLNRKFQNIEIQAEVFGPDFDTLQPKVQAVEESLIEMLQHRQALARQAQDPLLDPSKLAQTAADIAKVTAESEILRQKLEEFRQIQKVKQAFDNMADGIANAFDRALQSTGTAMERIKGFLKDSIDSINRELTKLLVTDPLKEWLKKMMGDLFPKIGLPVPSGAPGGAGAGVGQEAAIQATQIAATTAIQAQATAATAGMQAEQSVATIAIESTQTVAVTAIETLQASAIAAIQAAGAAAGGSTGGGSPSGLFGLLFGGDQPPGLNPAQIAAGEYHQGGRVGRSSVPIRMLPASLILNAPRYHTGGDVGAPPLKPGEVPLVARVGERISTEEQWNAATSGKGANRTTTVTMNIHGLRDRHDFERSKRSIIKDMQRAIDR